MKTQHQCELEALRREFAKPDISLHQEIIYDESGIQIGATSRLKTLEENTHDPRNTTGKNF